MEALTIIPLGTSAAAPTATRNVSATLLKLGGHSVLVDCGEGTQHRLQKCGWRPGSLAVICITHLHGDHCYGVPGLLATLGMQGRTAPLTLIGPPGVRAYVDGMRASTYLHLPYELTVLEATEGPVFTSRDFSLTVAPLEHRIPAIGFSFVESEQPGPFDVAKARALGVPEGPFFRQLQYGQDVLLKNGVTVRSSEVVGPPRPGRKVVYCCDTIPCDSAVELARDADVLIHEATYADDLKEEAAARGHSTAREAANVARRARVRRLMLTHISARYDDPSLLLTEAQEVFSATQLAVEMEEVVVGARR